MLLWWAPSPLPSAGMRLRLGGIGLLFAGIRLSLCGMRLRDCGFAMLSSGIGMSTTGIELSFDAAGLPPRGIPYSEPVDDVGCSNCEVSDSLSPVYFLNPGTEDRILQNKRNVLFQLFPGFEDFRQAFNCV